MDGADAKMRSDSNVSAELERFMQIVGTGSK